MINIIYNNWFITDKIVIYSSRLLYEEDVKKVEAIDRLINKIENLSMYMAYCMKQDIGEEIEDCLTEFKIRTEEDYLRRADNLKTLSRDLQNDIDFIGFAKSIQNSEGFTNFTDYMKESPKKIAQKWSKFKTDVIRTRERIKKLPDTLLTLSEESDEKYSKHDVYFGLKDVRMINVEYC